jgi:Flp pilus assembly protein TadG
LADEYYVACASPSRSQAGSATVEFGLVMVPLFAFLFLLFSTAWVVFARATLQNAVREGVRFGVTGQTLGASCLGSSIQQVVYQYAFGFIPASKLATEVTVTYYNPSTLAVISGSGSTAGGNVLQVSVSGLSVSSFAPVWRSSSPINLSASASDVLESPPNGILPCP